MNMERQLLSGIEVVNFPNVTCSSAYLQSQQVLKSSSTRASKPPNAPASGAVTM